MAITVEFVKSGRGKAQCPPNPDYPEGVAIDAAALGEKACSVDLPYPAPECGTWMVRCDQCQMSVAITAAGRIDDPVSVRVPCRMAVN